MYRLLPLASNQFEHFIHPRVHARVVGGGDDDGVFRHGERAPREADEGLAGTGVGGVGDLQQQVAGLQDGDRVALILPLALRPQFANPRVRQDVGRVALMRGPLVYCVETTDNGEDLAAIILPKDLPAAETAVLDNLNGAVAVDLDVIREDTADWGQSLYRKEPAKRKAARARFVPYHLWDNREPGEMLVWVQAE